MKKFKLGCVLAAAAMVFSMAACGNKEEKTTTTTEPTVEITEAEFPDTSEAVTEVQHEGYYNDLTGEWNTERTTPYGRPISVMINNIIDAMPQSDVSKADIVYECVVEGGITRLLAIFNDYDNIEKLGSIRSCRHYYVTIANEFDSIYLHYGQSPQGQDMIDSTGINDLSGLSAEGSTVYYRSSDRSAPHNVYTTTDMIKAGIEYKGYSTEHPSDFKSVFKFNDEVVTPEGGETANKITTAFNSSRTPWFEYHSDDGLYYRFQYGEEHIDDVTGEQLKYENVLIQFAEYSTIDDYGRQDIALVGKGDGYYASNGVIVPVTWEKTSLNSQTKYYTAEGEELKLNPGKTWVTVFEKNDKSNVTYE